MNNPYDIVRRYYLTSEDRGAAGDTTYAIVFTDRGQMVVRVTRHHGQQYRPPDVHDIPASEFPTTTVKGVPLARLVVEKLNEVLPASN